MTTRRHFISTALAGAASLSTGAMPVFAAAAPRKNKLCAFTKHLQGLSYDQIADIGAECGLDGLESPVRPGGHVEPMKIEEDLPKFMEALKKRNLELTIMTSGINQVSKEQNTEKVLRTAAALGVKRFRMWYFKYDLKKPILPQVEEWRVLIKDLVQLCDELGIQPMVQNHSGKDYFGAPVWDAFSIMKDYKPKQFGFALDSLHTTVEGGLSWPLEIALVRDYLGAVYFKDFKWEGQKDQTVPLGTGQVSRDFAKAILKLNFEGPISLHTEYMVDKANKKVPDADFVKRSTEAFKRDLSVLKDWMEWS